MGRSRRRPRSRRTTSSARRSSRPATWSARPGRRSATRRARSGTGPFRACSGQRRTRADGQPGRPVRPRHRGGPAAVGPDPGPRRSPGAARAERPSRPAPVVRAAPAGGLPRRSDAGRCGRRPADEEPGRRRPGHRARALTSGDGYGDGTCGSRCGRARVVHDGRLPAVSRDRLPGRAGYDRADTGRVRFPTGYEGDPGYQTPAYGTPGYHRFPADEYGTAGGGFREPDAGRRPPRTVRSSRPATRRRSAPRTSRCRGRAAAGAGVDPVTDGTYGARTPPVPRTSRAGRSATSSGR